MGNMADKLILLLNVCKSHGPIYLCLEYLCLNWAVELNCKTGETINPRVLVPRNVYLSARKLNWTFRGSLSSLPPQLLDVQRDDKVK